MEREIRWVELPNELVDLAPVAQLAAFTAAAEQRPSGVPWIGLIAPQSRDGSYKEIALSLVGGTRFSGPIIDQFTAEASRIAQSYSSEEQAWVRRDQRNRGNPEEVWSADESLLRVVAPTRLVGLVQAILERLLELTPHPIDHFEE